MYSSNQGFPLLQPKWVTGEWGHRSHLAPGCAWARAGRTTQQGGPESSSLPWSLGHPAKVNIFCEVRTWKNLGEQCGREGAQACGWDRLPGTGCPVLHPENLLLVLKNHGSALKAHPDVRGPEWSPDWSGALAVGPQPEPLGEKLSQSSDRHSESPREHRSPWLHVSQIHRGEVLLSMETCSPGSTECWGASGSPGIFLSGNLRSPDHRREARSPPSHQHQRHLTVGGCLLPTAQTPPLHPKLRSRPQR